jgi:hypothetical protein
LAAAAIGPAAAHADQEVWTISETRVRVSEGTWWIPSFARTWTDFRFSRRHDGLGLAFFRVGPIWDLHPALFVAAHATTAAIQGTGAEYRLELEPNLRGRLGPLTFNDRNRLERRWRDDNTWWRYRNQLRVNWAPEGARFIPFVADEILADIGASELEQNRLQVGLGVVFWGQSRVDVSYQLRTRRAGVGWINDNMAVLYLYYQPR